MGRKIKEGVEEAAKTAKQSAESVSKGGEKLGQTAAFRALSQVSGASAGEWGAWGSCVCGGGGTPHAPRLPGSAPRPPAVPPPPQGVETVKKEIDDSVLGQTGPYRRPSRLRKRTEFAGEKLKENRVFQANE